MIPLARWLRNDEARADGEDAVGVAVPAAAEHSGIIDDFSEDVVDAATARIESLEQENEDLHRQIEVLRMGAVAREQELVGELADVQASLITTELQSGLARLQSNMEQALVDVLAPVLGQIASRRATDELLTLMVKSMKESPEPLLILKAPRTLHSRLQALAEETSGVSLAESQQIELVFTSGRARFEELAARWIDIISGSAA